MSVKKSPKMIEKTVELKSSNKQLLCLKNKVKDFRSFVLLFTVLAIIGNARPQAQ